MGDMWALQWASRLSGLLSGPSSPSSGEESRPAMCCLLQTHSSLHSPSFITHLQVRIHAFLSPYANLSLHMLLLKRVCDGVSTIHPNTGAYGGIACVVRSLHRSPATGKVVEGVDMFCREGGRLLQVGQGSRQTGHSDNTDTDTDVTTHTLASLQSKAVSPPVVQGSSAPPPVSLFPSDPKHTYTQAQLVVFDRTDPEFDDDEDPDADLDL